MKIILLATILFLSAITAHAQDVANDLTGLGMPAEQASYIGATIGDAVTLAATGSTQTDAAAIIAAPPGGTFIRVTGADATKGVKLPALNAVQAGVQYVIINSDVTNALRVYSNAAGDLITAQAGTTAITVAAKINLTCTKFNLTNWYCFKGVLPY